MNIDEKQKKTRRIFFNDIARNIAWVGLAAGGFRRYGIPASGEKGKVLTTLKISDYKELEKIGGFVLIKETAAGDLLIIRSGAEQYNALSNVCPHRQCRVEVKSESMIQCPCHQSSYKTDGTYVAGPAKASLKKFPVTLEAGVLTAREN